MALRKLMSRARRHRSCQLHQLNTERSRSTEALTQLAGSNDSTEIDVHGARGRRNCYLHHLNTERSLSLRILRLRLVIFLVPKIGL